MKSKDNDPIDNWSIGPAIPFGCSHEKFPSSSCAASLTTQLAATDLEELSEAEQAELAEHLKTCLACSAILAEYQQIKEAFVGCPTEEPYTDEPESQLSPQLIQMWEEDGVDIVKKLAERRQRTVSCMKTTNHFLKVARKHKGWTQIEAAQTLTIHETWFWSAFLWEINAVLTWLLVSYILPLFALLLAKDRKERELPDKQNL